ncbi:MAG: DotI/IcmL family type IV secretion protein, partial [Gammaproteobacteria bacterium]|nr:DotI/IcmL family type IV secretion protein [Gammaproteobacteria bacterium]
MRKWLIIITCAIVILAVYIFGIKTGEKIAAKSTTQPKSALAIPNMSNTELGVWANEAAATIFSYNFSNYKEALQKSQIYFTPAGWKSYEAAFTKSPTLKMVLKDKLVV